MSTGETQVRSGDLAVGRRWSFGPAVLDERTLELVVNGLVARIERKPLEVLLYLLHHAGEVVTKEELAENLWPGRILTESVLTRCVSQLRQVLEDDARTVIRTVHGFGYRLVAEVRVDATSAAAPPAFTFKAGDPITTRPQWRLEERLGTGGHGEAWLARHEKTHDARVFKFALDAGTLASLKREITLYRVLSDSLGERAAVVRIFEWNLEEAPCFIEAEYVSGRDLRAWAEAHGGLAGMPLALRLDLVAQIAEAVAAAHSVGVLHKDLKPGNVLIEGAHAGPPRVKLADFGCGGVLDTGRLDALGITNLGLTTTGANQDESGGTPLYLAPEVIAGQPFTVGADIYALGVMLYQLVVGDLRQALAPGWELKVPDELLREDIALAAAGEPARRLADAGQLAERLRSLEARRQTRAAEAAASERAERTRRVLAELRRTRVFAAAVLVLALAAVVGGVTAYRARNDALAARATTEAVNRFLMDDVLGIDAKAERPKDASYESLLTRAASQVDVRFKDQPEAAANVHWLLGRRFREVGRVDLAEVEYEKASALLPELKGHAALPALLALSRLIPIYADRGRRAETIATSERLLEQWAAEYGPTDLSTVLLRGRIARMLGFVGELRKAESAFRSALVDLPHATLSKRTWAAFDEWLGFALSADTSLLVTDRDARAATDAYIKTIYAEYLGRYAQNSRKALPLYREALSVFSKLLGEDSETTTATRFALAVTLAIAGHQDEARQHLMRAQQFSKSSLPPRHWLHGVVELFRARVELEQDPAKPSSLDAVAILEKASAHCVENGCSHRVIEEIRYSLARGYAQSHDLERAINVYEQTLESCEALSGKSGVDCLMRRLGLAEVFLQKGDFVQVARALSGVTPDALSTLPAPHLVVADFKRVQGLTWLATRKRAEGEVALGDSLKIVEHHFDSDHWRVRRARAELSSKRQETYRAATKGREILTNR